MKVGAAMLTAGAITFAVMGNPLGYFFALIYGAAAVDMWVFCLGWYR